MSDDSPSAPERPRVSAIDPPKVKECDACLERHLHRYAVAIGWDEKYICRPCALALFAGLDVVLVPNDKASGA